MANRLEVELIADDKPGLVSVDRFERAILGTEQRLGDLGKLGSSAGSAIGSGLGIPLGPAAALTAATVAVVAGINSAIEAARSAADANRVLSSSATEAGLAYDVANEKAQKFAQQTGLSATQAKQTFASIVQASKVAGQTDDLDNIQRRLADLAAARGVAAQDLATLSQQILSGQDEALNRLGLADPSKLAKEWADAHGRTVESMTQAEQVASRLDAVVRKGALFDGSAESRLNSVEGQMIRTEAAMDNLTAGVGQGILANKEFRDLLGEVNRALASISVSSDEVRKKLAQGISPEQIAKEQVGSFSRQTDLLKAGLTALPASFALAFDSLTGDSETALNRFRAALQPGKLRQDELTEGIKNQQRLMDLQNQEAADQKIANAQRVDDERRVLAAKQQQLEVAKQQKAEEERQREIRATFTDTRAFLDDINQRVNRDNPFVKLFSEADTVMDRMQKRFGAFGREFVDMMAKVELQANAMEQLAARIQSAQKVLDLQAEIRKLQFGPTGISAEDQRRLSVFDRRIEAARDIPGLEASARAVEQGRLPGNVDQTAVLGRQIDEIRKLKTQFLGSDAFGTRAAQSKINEQIIALFQSASPEMQRRLLQGGFRGDLAGAFQGQANDRKQAIIDEQRRADAGRLAVQGAQTALADLKRFGTIDNDEVRKVFISRVRGLGEGEVTPQLRLAQIQALDVEARKEAEKEKKAAEDQQKLNTVLDLILGQAAAGGIKVNLDNKALLTIDVKDTSSKASVTGPGFTTAAEADAARNSMMGL